MSLWDAKDIADAVGGQLVGDDFAASSVSIDSRTVQHGGLFIALKGERFDGHDHVAGAFASGASGAIVSRAGNYSGSVIIVADTERALADLARHARKRARARIIGITGSVGKTSAKEMLKLAFNAHGATFASSGNYNNHLGLPLSLCNMPRDTQFGIFEMGMNHAGEIAHLSHILRPEIMLVTTVEAVHLEHFESVEAIARAKGECFEGMQAGGIAVLNADNRYTPILEELAQARDVTVMTFGQSATSSVTLSDVHTLKTGTEAVVLVGGKRYVLRLGTVGAHWPLIAAGVIGAVAAAGYDPQPSLDALATYREPAGRGEIVELAWGDGTLTLIDDAYNASPVSMRGAIEKLSLLPTDGRRLAIIGEMRELGSDAERFHLELVPSLMIAKVDGVWTLGDGAAGLQAALPAEMQRGHFAKAAELVIAVLPALQADDLVLCKGSHGSHAYEVVQAIRSANKGR